MLFDTYAMFDFEVRLELSTRPEQRSGSEETWDRAEDHLAEALDARGLRYELNPGDGAFYGPKIDIHITDSLGRSWQLGTVQIDYSMPERFGVTYTGADNAEHQPVMIHRALFGSYERFIGIMLEHYAGELPLWLAPVQAIVLAVSDRFNDYARGVRDTLAASASSAGGAARRAGRAQRVDRAQDPRGGAAQGPVHAGRRRARAGRSQRVRARAPRRRPRRDAVSQQFTRSALRRAIVTRIAADEILTQPPVASA